MVDFGDEPPYWPYCVIEDELEASYGRIDEERRRHCLLEVADRAQQGLFSNAMKSKGAGPYLLKAIQRGWG
eukprot:7099456-Prorocentrum_lima.AAC.1